MKHRLLSLLVLLLTAASGAWAKTIDLSTLTVNTTAEAGDVLTGKTTTYLVTIAAEATVTLDGVNITSSSYCIKCAGNATIILKDGTTNKLTSSSDCYPALWAGDENTTLTIKGSTGVLIVQSGLYCAGIGGGNLNYDRTCGNITIEGGIITAQGGNHGAGIGTDAGAAACGDITITGGTVTATGGLYAAGIGGGFADDGYTQCGKIKIDDTVTKVTATAGEGAPCSIGKGYGTSATCGTVTIGGTVYAYGISDSPFTYAPIKVTWDAETKTGTFDMIASDVVLTPIYAKTAAFATTGTEPDVTTLLPEAAEGVIAGTDAPLIVEGTVAFAGTSTEVKQGTVMYAVTLATVTEAPALTSSDWKNTVPTAKDIADDGAEVKVWYYIQGADAPQGEAATLDNTFNNSDICATPLTVTVLSNKFDLTLKAANVNTIDATQASKGTVTVNGTDKTEDITEGKLKAVKMGSEVKLKANNGYKFRKVEVKKDKKTLTITDGDEFSITLDITGCTTWDEVITKNSNMIMKNEWGYIYDSRGQYDLHKGDGDNEVYVNADNPFDPNATDYHWKEIN